jgi:hypothetical protein
MRSIALLTVLMMHLMAPLVVSAWTTEARDEELVGIVAPDDVVVHRNETVSTFITLHNKANTDQTFTIAPFDVPDMLSVVGLPVSQELVPNHVKQLAFGIRANASAPYQTVPVSFTVASDLEGVEDQTVSMEVVIAPWSNLTFGVQGISSFTVDENTRTSVAVNLSNNGTMTDNVSFSIDSTSSWEWGWTMDNIIGDSAYLVVEPGQLIYAYLWVDVPPVIDGAPLAETGPRFTLSATSSLDRAVSSWAFDLLMNEKKNVSIDAVETDAVVAPNQDGRLQIVVRNVGNTPNTLNMTLQALTEEGQPLPNSSPADRFTSNGWVVALFGGLEDLELQPNESRTIEVGFQAPNEFSGQIDVEIRVFASGAMTLLKTARMTAEILRTTDAEASYQATGCEAILPNQSCMVSLEVQNTGNAYNTFSLRQGTTTDGFSVIVPSQSLLLQSNEVRDLAPITITASSDALAFTLGTAVIEVLGDNGELLDEVEIPLKVAPEIKWTFRNIEEQTNAKGRMSIAMEVRNEGNAVDGLIVQLQSSHFVEMGFIPPDIAVYEDGVEYPRSFEINDIPLNSNFTIRAWVELPQDQSSNGTVYINTSIRSRFAPELPFIHTSVGEYLGSEWQPQQVEENGLDWGGMASTAFAYVKAWSGVIFSIALAGGIIYKAMIDRERRMNASNLLPYQQVEATADDWMNQFSKQDEEPLQLPQPTAAPVAKATFEAMFRQSNGQASVAQAPVDTTLVAAATLVLDQRTKEASASKPSQHRTAAPPETRASPQQDRVELPPKTTPVETKINLPNLPEDDDLEF